ncbi:MAG: 2-amino-4-hydroxy-6-hydroxymethyldihydropteridine diphosphokinase [Gemmatimonadota bacterium]|nr:2-amino-4-hydroxy-6-hydroxymethyldihydropteridine diphosphokinase [Gemmatimonadota bacterium]
MRDVAYIALGSNLGDRSGHLAAARIALEGVADSRVIAASAIEETAPLDDRPQPPFFNQMIALETTLTPRALLGALQAIERALGRERAERWGDRTIDLDIVCFQHQTADEPGLVVPHPGLAVREFWRRELAELRPHRIAT